MPGFVTGVDRGRYTLLVHEGGERVVTAMKARELGRKGVVVGDEVALVGDVTGGPDSLARIVRVEPRRTVLRRTADDTDPVRADHRRQRRPAGRRHGARRPRAAATDGRPVPRRGVRRRAGPAAGADQGRPGRPGTVPRQLRAARRALRRHPARRPSPGSGRGSSPCTSGWAAGAASSSGTPASASPRWSTRWCRGPAGPSAWSTTSPAAAGTPRPRPSRCGCPGPRAGSSTPRGCARSGWRTSTRPGSSTHFPDLEPGTAECPRGCTHDEPECALDAWVEAGRAGPAGRSRLDSLRRLLRARSPQPED